MIHIKLPQNLDMALKIPAILVFPAIEDSFSVPAKKEFFLLGNSLKVGEDTSMNSSEVFNRLGYCNCIIVNLTLTILQNMIWIIIYILILSLSLILPKLNLD